LASEHAIKFTRERDSKQAGWQANMIAIISLCHLSKKSIGSFGRTALMSNAKLWSFANRAGLEITETTSERAVARIKIRKELCNRSNTASGGLIMALADELVNMLTPANLPNGTYATTIDSNTNFTAPIPEGVIAHIECSLIYNEQNRMVWQTKITRADGRLAAIVSQTQLINPAGR